MYELGNYRYPKYFFLLEREPVILTVVHFLFLSRSFLKHSAELVYMMECKHVSVILQGNATVQHAVILSISMIMQINTFR